MCATCGCFGEARTTVLNLQTGVSATIAGEGPRPHDLREHVHADGTRHSHPQSTHEHIHTDASVRDHSQILAHHPGEDHHQHPSAATRIDVERRILDRNHAVAERNRAWFADRKILALNLVSSPGAGKTTLLERTIARLAGSPPPFVIEGDQATANDGERIRSAGAPVVQINTGTGCHLDAEMVGRSLSELRPTSGAVLFIENVGNLVCPALFDLGEHAKVVIFSATDGEDKPLKYPYMFRAAEVVILNKIDLLPHLDFSVERALAHVERINPDAAIFELSARTGGGIERWVDWIRSRAACLSAFAAPVRFCPAAHFAHLEDQVT